MARCCGDLVNNAFKCGSLEVWQKDKTSKFQNYFLQLNIRRKFTWKFQWTHTELVNLWEKREHS